MKQKNSWFLKIAILFRLKLPARVFLLLWLLLVFPRTFFFGKKACCLLLALGSKPENPAGTYGFNLFQKSLLHKPSQS